MVAPSPRGSPDSGRRREGASMELSRVNAPVGSTAGMVRVFSGVALLFEIVVDDTRGLHHDEAS